MPVELRRAKPPDADFLLELLGDEDVRRFLRPRTAATRDLVLEEIERSLAEPESFGRFVIESDGEPAGMFGFHVVNEPNRIARLELDIYAFNERACAHAERAGYVREGRKRKAYRRDGEWVDSVLYALVAEDLAAG